ncbi:hypothetical protein PR003_g149 [Phytophthora rubi]|nr:hypothetical protein PR003_g149 [Phytophthora rubi]
MEAEDAIQDCVIGRQIVRYPVGGSEILKKTQEISELVAGYAVTDGWNKQFMGRHLDLTNCSDIRLLLNPMTKVIIETGASADQIFNVDETAFCKAAKSKRVVAVRHSKNVWTTTPTTP